MTGRAKLQSEQFYEDEDDVGLSIFVDCCGGILRNIKGHFLPMTFYIIFNVHSNNHPSFFTFFIQLLIITFFIQLLIIVLIPMHFV